MFKHIESRIFTWFSFIKYTNILKSGPQNKNFWLIGLIHSFKNWTGQSDWFNRELVASPVRLKPLKPVKNRGQTGNLKKNDLMPSSVLKPWFDPTFFSRDVGQQLRGSKGFFFLSLEEEWMRPRYRSRTVKIGGKILEEIKLIGQKNKLSRWI